MLPVLSSFWELPKFATLYHVWEVFGICSLQFFLPLGDYDGAKSKLMLSLQMKEKRYGEAHINLVPTLMNLGDLFNLTKQPSRAKDVLTRALKINEKVWVINHSN